MRSTRGIVALVALLSAAPADARRSRPDKGDPITLADLEWPETTRSLKARPDAQVHARPGSGKHDGKLAVGSRVAWKQIVAGRGRCKGWIEIEPRGWVCSRDVQPSDLEPAPGITPARVVAKTEAKEFLGVVPTGTDAYDTQGAIRKKKASRRLEGWTFLRESRGKITVAGTVYHRTKRGWVADHAVEPRKASDFAGVEIARGIPGWPLAWVLPRSRDAKVAVRAEPSVAATKLRELSRRDLVVVHETRDGFARIGVGEWVALIRLRVARTQPRPDGVAADERWIDIDLDQQVLVAYRGDTPTYATMVSTGTGRTGTPTGIYRIKKKYTKTRMRNPDIALGSWDVPDVPFSMGFRKHYAMHGAYWHDSFGRKRSHGCVNLTPRDARYVFEFSYPHVPDGWISARARDGEGTPLQIRSRKDRTPEWIDYDVEAPVRTREDLVAELDEL